MTTRDISRFVACLALVGLLRFGVTDARAQDGDDARRPIELRPYQIQISIAFGHSPELNAGFRDGIFRDVADASRRLLGQMWILDVSENRWLFPRNQTGLGRLSAEKLRDRYQEKTIDKVFLFVVDSDGSGLQISGREWDKSTQSISPLVKRWIYDRRALGAEVFAMSQELFRPISEIDDVDEQDVFVRVRAGEYLPADPDAAQLKPQDLLQPYMRYLDRKLVLQKVQMMPWSYLVVQKTNRGRIECQFKTGLRNPLGGKSRRRVEVFASRLNRIADRTRLKLMPTSNVSRPLYGYSVSIAPKHPREMAKPAEPAGNQAAKDGESAKDNGGGKRKQDDPAAMQYTRLLSDRSGRVEIKVDEKNSVVWLYVRSGKNLLAILPFAPGIAAEEIMKLPDDALRLGVEGSLALLEAELIDTVARRALLMAMATSHSRKDKWDQVDGIFEQLDDLPKTKFFESKLTAIRFPAIKAAEELRDRRSQSKIKKLCNQMLQSIRQHLDPTKPKELKAELEELRKLDDADRKQGEADKAKTG